MSTMSFVVEQAPMAMGYALYSITLGKDEAGQPVLEKVPVAFQTSLVEITVIRGRIEKDAFGAEALPAAVERVHYLPAPQQHQSQHPPRPDQYPPMEGRPSVLDGMESPPPREPDASLVEKARAVMGGRNGRERANAVLFAVCVTLAMAAHSMGLRA